MNKLPKPKCKYGYTREELELICKKLNIKIELFWHAFGQGNTCMIYRGKPRFYSIDVERALYNLRHKLGKYHIWD